MKTLRILDPSLIRFWCGLLDGGGRLECRLDYAGDRRPLGVVLPDGRAGLGSALSQEWIEKMKDEK